MKCIADTGFIVAFLNKRDTHHRWAYKIAEQLSAPAKTCDAVLAEASFHTQDTFLVFSLIESGLLELDFDLSKYQNEIQKLAKRYRDREPDLADLCLIKMSELDPNRALLTTDIKDFSVYRRNGKEKIPLICPR